MSSSSTFRFLPPLALSLLAAQCGYAAPDSTLATATPMTASASKPSTPAEAKAVVEFWRQSGPSMWFAKDAAFDRRFRERFLALHERAARGELSGWMATPDGALALMVLLDQFPRNAFRDTAHMYATDAHARRLADEAIRLGYDRAVEGQMQRFFYLPFGHSEDLADQERAVELCRRLGPEDLAHAEHHRDIVRRFGRFPHRNPILGRAMKPEEQRYLDEGGYRG